MKAKVIFTGSAKEEATIKAALAHYVIAIECAHIGVESVPPRPLLASDRPLDELRMAKKLVRDING